MEQVKEMKLTLQKQNRVFIAWAVILGLLMVGVVTFAFWMSSQIGDLREQHELQKARKRGPQYNEPRIDGPGAPGVPTLPPKSGLQTATPGGAQATATTTSTTTTTTTTTTTPPRTRKPLGDWDSVVQARFYGDVDFSRSWAEYKLGFGDLAGDFWIGNDNLHRMCPPENPCEVRFEITFPEEPHNVPRQPLDLYVAEYRIFSVSSEAEQYKLTCTDYDATVSTAGDSIKNDYEPTVTNNGMPFSTMDRDNDNSGRKFCAQVHGYSGWWFDKCGRTLLNGVWGVVPDEVPYYQEGIMWWETTRGKSGTSSRMLVRFGNMAQRRMDDSPSRASSTMTGATKTLWMLLLGWSLFLAEIVPFYIF